MKYLLLGLLLTSCAVPTRKEPKAIPVFKSKQDRIMECLSFVRSLGSDDKFSGEFCRGIYKGE